MESPHALAGRRPSAAARSAAALKSAAINGGDLSQKTPDGLDGLAVEEEEDDGEWTPSCESPLV